MSLEQIAARREKDAEEDLLASATTAAEEAPAEA